MTTVRQFVGATSLWHEITPAMERVTRYCNYHSVAYTSPIQRAGAPGGAALTAETAFRLATLGDVDLDDALIEQSLADAAAFLRVANPTLGMVNMREVEELRRNLVVFFSPPADFDFFPHVPGVGTVEETSADVRSGPTLYEVKTVVRGWHSTDLRQCLTYAAMLYAAGDRLQSVVLVNPRRGRSTHLSLAEVAVAAGAGSAPEMLNGILYRMLALSVSG